MCRTTEASHQHPNVDLDIFGTIYEMGVINLQMDEWTMALVLFDEYLGLHVDVLPENHMGPGNVIRTFNTIKGTYKQTNIKVATTLQCLRLAYLSARKIGSHNMEETYNGDYDQPIEWINEALYI